MKIVFIGDGSTHQLTKAALTIFPDGLTTGVAECYLDVVNTEGGTFQLLFDENEYIKDSMKSRTEFFHDAVVCHRFLNKYERLEGGFHKSLIGGELLKIREHLAELSPVSPPEDIRAATSVAVDLGAPCEPGEAVSTWIHWKQRCPQIEGIVKTRWSLRVATRNIEIQNLYLYVVLPKRFRLIQGRVLCGHAKEPFHDHESGHRSLIEILQEAYLDSSFPVYNEWRPMFWGRHYLHERRQLDLKSLEQAELDCEVASNELTQRHLALTYFAGLVFASSTSLYANSLFAMANDLKWGNFVMTMYIVSSACTILAGIWGWRLLTKAMGFSAEARISHWKRIQIRWKLWRKRSP